MTYMTVAENTHDRLVLKRSPGLYSAVVAVGIYAFLLWLTQRLSDVDSNWWTPVSAVICFFVSLSSIDNWEIGEFNNTTGKIKLKKLSLYGKLLKQCPSSVIIPLRSIDDVRVEETVLKYVRQKMRVVTLISNEGHVYYVTGSGTSDKKKSHDEICHTIKEFLNIKDR